MTLEEVIEKLKAKHINLKEVAITTGINPNTLYAIVGKRNKNPSYETVLKLIKFIEENL